MPSDSDEKYWLGVRDALRMIDSFVEWAKRNPGRAKPLRQFLNEALIAAAKRCESCLSHTLGISFAVSEDDQKEERNHSRIDFFESSRSIASSSPLAHTLRDPDDLYIEETPPAPPPPPPEKSSFEQTPRVSKESSISDSDRPIMTTASPKEEPPEPRESGSTEVSSDTPTKIPLAPVDSVESSPIGSLKPTGTLREEDVGPTGPPRDIKSEFQVEVKSPTESVESPEIETLASVDLTFEDDSLTEIPEEIRAEPISKHEHSEKTVTLERVEAPVDSKLPDALDELQRYLNEHGFGDKREQPPRIEESSPPSETTFPESEETKPFTWKDYEETIASAEVTEPERDTPTESSVKTSSIDTEVAPTEESESESLTAESVDSTSTRSPFPARRDMWTPYDEPSPIEPTEESSESHETGSGSQLTKEESPDESIDTPPPPPPPPLESDEGEEERQRRTRRLFFGE